MPRWPGVPLLPGLPLLLVALALQPLHSLPLLAAEPYRGAFGPLVRSLNTTPHGYTRIPDPTGTATAPIVERFEVRPGDCSHHSRADDCTRDRERSELSEQGERNLRGTSAWYGWYLYFPLDWPDVWPTKTVIAQFHQDRSHPVWMFLNYRGGLALDDMSTGRSRRKVELIPADRLRGRWHRIEVHARWDATDRGRLAVWVDGSQKFEFAGPTMTAEKIYFKYGVYRAFVSRYASRHGGAPAPRQIAYFANVRKAATRADLEAR